MLTINQDVVALPHAAFALVQQEHLVTRDQIQDEFYATFVDDIIDPDLLDEVLAEHAEHMLHRPATLGEMVKTGIVTKQPTPELTMLDTSIEPAELDTGIKTHMGLSVSRIVAVQPDPEVVHTEYQKAVLTKSDRVTISGCIPSVTWKVEDNIMAYLEIFSKLPERELAAEMASDIYGDMMSQIRRNLFVEGKLNKALADRLDLAGYETSYNAQTNQLMVNMTMMGITLGWTV